MQVRRAIPDQRRRLNIDFVSGYPRQGGEENREEKERGGGRKRYPQYLLISLLKNGRLLISIR